MRRTRHGLVVAAALAAAMVARPVAAQETTPAAAGCEVVPRTVAEIVAAGDAATPVAVFDLPGAATPASQPVPAAEPAGPGTPLEIELPEGEPAPDETVAGMRATMEAFLACANAGDVLRTLALVTDDYIVDSFGRGALTAENIADYAAEPRPVPTAQQRAVAAVREARVLPGGRVAALVDLAATGGPVPGEVRTDFIVFVPTADGYAIDSIQAGLPPETFGPNAEPVG
jgi:hypothetical protein